MLSNLIVLPWLGILVLAFVPSRNTDLIRKIGAGFAGLCFVLSLQLWVLFDNQAVGFQFVEVKNWMFPVYFGIDGISLFFVLLTTFLILLCIIATWESIQTHVKAYMMAFLVMGSFLVCVFTVLDLLFFYIFFESVLIPMFLMIGIWGSRARKGRAAYLFFFYTLLGSLFMLLAILTIAFETGTTDYQVLLTTTWSESRQIFLWVAFFASFAVKVPMVPFHIWLPEAHVEAPTAGSVMLAGVLLKLGTYGFIRFSIPLFPEASAYFTPFMFTMSVVAIVYTSLTTLRQGDLKKIIAYSSVAHMGFVTLGLFTGNVVGLEGAMMIMLSHGWVSSALFLCVGVLYDRYHTRLVKYYQGLTQAMPLFAIVFTFFSMANLGFPGTSSFAGEFMSLAGAFEANVTVAILAAIGTVLGAAYSVWLCNRVLFGPLQTEVLSGYSDLVRREAAVFAPLIFMTLWMGIYPEVFLQPMHLSILYLCA